MIQVDRDSLMGARKFDQEFAKETGRQRAKEPDTKASTIANTGASCSLNCIVEIPQRAPGLAYEILAGLCQPNTGMAPLE
jgi:hypothetical protein